MTQAIATIDQKRKDEWIARIESLVSEIETWAVGEGWRVERDRKMIQEKSVGEYAAATLLVHMPDGEVQVNPIALDLIGRSDGRVDLEGFPTLSRVKLLGGHPWTIMTDSRVPIRQPWNRETFIQLAKDMVNLK